jgi:hypothetical protein
VAAIERNPLKLIILGVGLFVALSAPTLADSSSACDSPTLHAAKVASDTALARVQTDVDATAAMNNAASTQNRLAFAYIQCATQNSNNPVIRGYAMLSAGEASFMAAKIKHVAHVDFTNELVMAHEDAEAAVEAFNDPRLANNTGATTLLRSAKKLLVDVDFARQTFGKP